MLVKIEQEGGVKSIKIAEASDGLNAYQLAVKNDGFVGDYDAWKVTFKGDEGKDAFEVWEVSNPGGTLEQYNAFIKGEAGYTPVKGVDYFDGADGSDANVTSANIATALGYTPADKTDVFSFAATGTGDIASGDSDPVLAPYDFTLNGYYVQLTGAPTGSAAVFNLKKNGVSVTSADAVIDATETSSLTGIAPTLTTTSFLKGDLITPNIIQVGNVEPGKSAKYYLEITKL